MEAVFQKAKVMDKSDKNKAGRLKTSICFSTCFLLFLCFLFVFAICCRVVGNGTRFCDTERASQRLNPHIQGQMPEDVTEVEINPE